MKLHYKDKYFEFKTQNDICIWNNLLYDFDIGYERVEKCHLQLCPISYIYKMKYGQTITLYSEVNNIRCLLFSKIKNQEIKL